MEEDLLIAFIDDTSRVIIHDEFFSAENTENRLDAYTKFRTQGIEIIWPNGGGQPITITLPRLIQFGIARDNRYFYRRKVRRLSGLRCLAQQVIPARSS